MVSRREHVISWSGIWAGVLAGLATQLALTVLGGAIGLISTEGNSDASIADYAMGAAIWLAVSAAVGAYVGGMTAARAGGSVTASQGRFHGLLTGMLLLLLATLFTLNVLFRTISSTLGLAGRVASASAGAAATVGGAAANSNIIQTLGLEDEYRALTSGFNQQELNQVITEGAPELNQTQVAAATTVVGAVLRDARSKTVANLSNISEIPETIKKQAQNVRQRLGGPEFVTRLKRQGLTDAQAQEVVGSVTRRVDAAETRITETAQSVRDQAGKAAESARVGATRAAWLWLLLAGTMIGAGWFGGNRTRDERDAPLETPDVTERVVTIAQPAIVQPAAPFTKTNGDSVVTSGEAVVTNGAKQYPQ